MTFLLRSDGQTRAAVVGVLGEPALDGVAGEWRAAAGREERVGGQPAALGEPLAQDRGGGLGERRDAVFAAFAVAGDVGGGAEVDVGAM